MESSLIEPGLEDVSPRNELLFVARQEFQLTAESLELESKGFEGLLFLFRWVFEEEIEDEIEIKVNFVGESFVALNKIGNYMNLECEEVVIEFHLWIFEYLFASHQGERALLHNRVSDLLRLNLYCYWIAKHRWKNIIIYRNFYIDLNFYFTVELFYNLK